MRIHALYSMPHFGDHLRSIQWHLPDELMGLEIQASRRVTGIPPGDPPEDIFMVAAFDDIAYCGNHRVIYVEHGAGQQYKGITERRASYYHGGQHPPNVIAYISPRQEVADSWGEPAFAAGAPICDTYPHDTGNGNHPCAAITLHWNCRVAPEAWSTLPHWGDHLEALVDRLRRQGFAVVGHHHPKDLRLPRIWRNLGVELVDADTVRRTADLLIADNTSMMYEMAYLGRTVVCLTAPWWRRDVSHGLRFWRSIPGTQVDQPDELLALDFRCELANLGFQQASAAKGAYGKERSDGLDGKRAADWIAQFVETL